MTAYPNLRKYSTEAAPLEPVEKLSIKRTVFFSKGTVVPPEETIAIHLPIFS
jgi:hypothetical protein